MSRVEAYIAAQRTCDQPADGQSEPEALGEGVELDEPFENMLVLSFGHTGAEVRNCEGDAAAVFGQVVGERNALRPGR